VSEGGGSEGLGFAIPAAAVKFVYEELKKYGYVHRTEIGVGVQEITPTLAAGLGLAQKWGVVISDVQPGGPADAAGLEVQDVLVAVDSHLILGLPGLTASLYLHPPAENLNVVVLRGSQGIVLSIPAIEHRDEIRRDGPTCRPRQPEQPYRRARSFWRGLYTTVAIGLA
jgi:serine protease Do